MSETITVAYVNQPKPGKKKGSIKDSNGNMYGVWPDKLALFQVGGTYAITYSVSSFNGAQYKNIETAQLVTPPAPKPATGGGGYGGGANDEHIFTSMMLKETVRAQLLDPNNVDEVIRLGRAMREAHKAIWAPVQQGNATSGTQQRQTAHPDMNDDIPW